MEFYVYSRSGIEAAAPHEVPHVIISITSGPSDRARLRTNACCQGILRLVFPDVEVAAAPHAEEDLFSDAQAQQIWAFVSEYATATERIVVDCDAGRSRSPAVAAALSRALTGDDGGFFADRCQPNRRVYRKLLLASGYARVP